MNNWKTTLSGVGLIITGIGGLIATFTGDGPGYETAVASIMAGLSGLGLVAASDGGV